MSTAPMERMTVDDFLRWQQGQPDGARHELVAGRAVAMAPERAAHARLKARIWQALDAAIGEKGLDCEAFPDGMTVVIDEATACEPDAVVQCGEALGPDEVVVPRPVIVVEVLSPSTQGRDSGAKLEDYFRIPGLTHYLLVKTERPAVIHHRRNGEGRIETIIARSGTLTLDPPGLVLDLAAIYRR
jgi:Uma2 family endonuclease